MEFKFKIGDKVKLPKQKSVGFGSVGFGLEYSLEYKEAIGKRQDYMYIVGTLTNDTEFGNCYVVGCNPWSAGDFFAEEDLELYEEEKQKINIPIELCREGVELPTYAREGDAGMDIRAAEDVVLNMGETKIVPTGLKVAIPEGYELQVRPRSGLSLKTPLRVANAPGTIDAGFRDEIGIIVTNTGDKYFTISKGDRIAQIVLQKVPRINWQVVNSVASIGENRGGGFGSTGIS